MEVEGVGVAMVTPFTPKGELDTAGLERITEKLCQEVDFLVPLGTTGETPTLTAEECEKVLDTVFAVNAGRLPIVVGCGGNNTAVVAQRMAYLENKYRPQAFLSVSPYYNKPNQTGIELHYQTLARQTKTPIMLYDVPGRTGRGVSAKTVAKLAGSVPNIMGLKDASGSLEQANELCLLTVSAQFLLASGDDKYAFAHQKLGYRAVISVAANVVGAEMKELWDLSRASNLFQKEQERYRAFVEFCDLIFEQGSPAGVKYALKAKGVCDASVRMPLTEISDELCQKIDISLQKMAR